MSEIPHSGVRSGRVGWMAVTVLTLLGAVGVWLLRSVGPVPLNDVRPEEVVRDGYASSDACRQCHEREFDTWHASYHRTMTQPVSGSDPPECLSAPRTEVRVQGLDYVFENDGETVWVEMVDPATLLSGQNKRVKRRVVLSTGSHHMQVFWYALEKSRSLGTVPAVFRIPEQRWIPRDAAFLTPARHLPRDESNRWNDTCLKCHTTDPRPRPHQSLPGHFQTQVGEFGISCEACHGPGQAHVAFRSQPNAGRSGEDPIVNPRRLGHELSSDVCGQCHSTQFTADNQFDHHGYDFRPGQALADSLRRIVRCPDGIDDPAVAEFIPGDPAGLIDLFWPDGEVRVAGREYSGLIESACYQRGGISCLSCHTLHAEGVEHGALREWADDQLQPHARGNAACVRCHQDVAAKLTDHTHHAAESSGSECMNCHMPHTSYGLLKASRTHRITSPSVNTALATGRLTACNQCHLDRSLGWTAGYLQLWYSHGVPEMDADERDISSVVLQALRGDAAQRALAAWSFGWPVAQAASTHAAAQRWMDPFVIELARDSYPAIRQIAARSLSALPGSDGRSIDPFGENRDREQVLSELRLLWDAADHPAGRPDLLLDSDGTLIADEFKRLRDARDDRTVDLQE